jgi:hypothetical protein
LLSAVRKRRERNEIEEIFPLLLKAAAVTFTLAVCAQAQTFATMANFIVSQNTALHT